MLSSVVTSSSHSSSEESFTKKTSASEPPQYPATQIFQRPNSLTNLHEEAYLYCMASLYWGSVPETKLDSLISAVLVPDWGDICVCHEQCFVLLSKQHLDIKQSSIMCPNVSLLKKIRHASCTWGEQFSKHCLYSSEMMWSVISMNWNPHFTKCFAREVCICERENKALRL